MKPSFTLGAMLAVALMVLPLDGQAGAEYQAGAPGGYPAPPPAYTPPAPARPIGGPYTYRYCLPYPHTGPGNCAYTPPSGMTHYAPGGWVYPGYAYAGHGASGLGPGPFLTGGIVGLTLGAIIF